MLKDDDSVYATLFVGFHKSLHVILGLWMLLLYAMIRFTELMPKLFLVSPYLSNVAMIAMRQFRMQ